MAAPMNWCSRGILFKKVCLDRLFASDLLLNFNIPSRTFPYRCMSNSVKHHPLKTKWRRVVFTTGAVMASTAVAASISLDRWRVYADNVTRPNVKVTRRIQNDTDSSGLKLTLFQYQTCPFCCKTRAFLDYYGLSYDVVEVNSVFRTELKWTKYRKVPVLVCDGAGKDGFLQINDSSVIISFLESHFIDPNMPLDVLLSYYPCLESKEGRKTVYEFLNKYYVMFPEKEALKTISEERSKERKWRQWTDDVLVHVLSPNIYRSPSEALQAFNYFCEVGDWVNVFSAAERMTIIYVGSAAMFVIGKMLKKKYHLKDDVRQSLYDVCNEWTQAVGNNKYLGGDKPNLADLSVYGTLHAIEGCEAFQDLLNNTQIGSWYFRTKEAVTSHAGANLIISK